MNKFFQFSKCIHPKDQPFWWLHENVIPAMMIALLLLFAILLIHKKKQDRHENHDHSSCDLNSKLPHKQINNLEDNNATIVASDYCVCVALPASPAHFCRSTTL